MLLAPASGSALARGLLPARRAAADTAGEGLRGPAMWKPASIAPTCFPRAAAAMAALAAAYNQIRGMLNSKHAAWST